MKFFRSLGATLFSLFLLAALAHPAAAQARIAFDSEAVDYGHVPFNQMVTHTFHLMNKGTEPLHIKGPFCHENLIRTKALAGC